MKRTPVLEKEPVINAEAKAIVEAMLAKYAALKSYSDKTQLNLEGATAFPAEVRSSFPVEATLTWQRPSELRFEGKSGGKDFLALSDEDTLHVINPKYPGVWLEREQNPPLVVTNADGTKTKTPPRLETAVIESGAMSFGFAFMTEPGFWPRTLKDVTAMFLEPEAKVADETCRVINIQTQSDQGNTSLVRLWIAREDNLLRQLELSYGGMGPNAKLVETHSQVRANPKIPDSTWAFVAPAKAKPIERFVNPTTGRKLEPAIKVGDTLPTFSGDDLKGQPLELNSKSGKVTIVHFFLMSMESHSLRILQKLQKAVGSDKLQIVAVSGDALPGRLEKFAEKHKLTLPIYFDENAMHNQLAQKFGVVGWSQTFLFGQDGKLKTIAHMPGELEFQTSIKTLLPGTPDDAFILQGNELLAAQ